MHTYPSHDMKPRILIVEDEVLVAAFTCAELEDAGFEPHSVATAMEGLEYLSANAFAAVIVDIGLPGMAGDELVRHIRQIDDELPILICTGFDATKYRRMFAGDRRLDVLQKPFSADELQCAFSDLAQDGMGITAAR
jgi:DNA-binding response OmpR family regulator